MLNRIRDAIDRFQQRVPVLAFPYAVMKKFGEDKAGQLAALVAYYGFFSLFPLLLAMVTVLSIVLARDPELQGRILGSALSQFPIVGAEIRENLGSISRSGVALVIGLATALWAGLAGIKAMQNGLDSTWDVPMRDQPRIVTQLIRGALMLVVLAAFVFVGTGLAGAGTEGESLSILARAFTFPASLIVNTLVFLLAFKILTVADVSWRDVLPGAVIAGIAWTALQAVGNAYVGGRLKNASEMYGLFGLVIGLLSWMYLGAQVTLIANEINVVRKKHLWPRSLGTEPQTEADHRALEDHAAVEERTHSEDVAVKFEKKDDRASQSR